MEGGGHFYLELTFSVNLYDRDGDMYSRCILIHRDSHILKFKNLDEYDEFIRKLQRMREEIRENVVNTY